MAKGVAVGAIEFSSVAIGYQTLDVMLKEATITLLMARPISPGKFLVVYSGKVADVETAMDLARSRGGESVVDFLTVASVCQALFPALLESVALPDGKIGALGVIETNSAVSAFIAADHAGKASNATLYRINVTKSMGGKGLLLIVGSFSDVQIAVEAGSNALQSGFLASSVVISNPERELFTEYK